MIMAKVNFKNLTKLKLALNFIRDKIKRTSSIKRGVEVQMPTSYGKFKLIPFLQIGTKKEHVVLFKGDLTDDRVSPKTQLQVYTLKHIIS